MNKKFTSKIVISLLFLAIIFGFGHKLIAATAPGGGGGGGSGCGGSTTLPYTYEYCQNNGTASFNWTVGVSVAQMPDYCEVTGNGSTTLSPFINGPASSVSFGVPFPTADGTYTFTGSCFNSTNGGLTRISVGAPVTIVITINSGGGGGGGGGGETADIKVISSNCKNAGLSWTMNPGAISGGWAGGTYPVTGDTSYTITPVVTSGTVAVTNSDGGGSSMFVADGDSKVFDILCTLPASNATLNVTSNNASGSWTINPGALAGAGTSGTYTVSPTVLGTLYTINPGAISGYTSSVSPASSILVFPGDSPTFAISYSAIAPPLNFTLSTAPTFTVAQGATVQVPITSQLLSGTPEPISFSSVGYNPSDIVNVSYAPQPCPNPNCIENVTFQVSPAAALGSQTVTVSGVSSPTGIRKSVSFALNIIPAASLSVSCSASPSPALVGQPVTWSSVVTGSVGPTTYSWAGDNFPTGPNAPTTQQYVLIYQTVGNKNASVTATDNGTARTASCPNTVLEVKVNPNFKEF